MGKAWDRHGQLFEVSFLRFGLKDDEPLRLCERQAAQKEIVDQAEDRRVHTDAERESQHGEQGEAGRFEKLADGEAEVGHWNLWFWFSISSSPKKFENEEGEGLAEQKG